MAARGALEAGQEAEIFLMGEAVYLMTTETADALNPVAWPKVGEILRDLSGRGVAFYV